jgi:polar amino acid transport system substrate-binding protein
MTQRIRRAGIGAGLLTAAMLLAGCAGGAGSGGGGGETTAPEETSDTFEIYGEEVPFNQELADMLPDDVKESGKLTASTDAAGPPRTFVDESGEIVGVIPDLLAAVGATLGVEVEIIKNTFDAEIAGIASGRHDMTTGTGDFPPRRELMDLVDYYRAGYVYLVQAGNPENVTDDEMSQCGLRVGVLKATTQEQLVTALSEKCVAAGEDPIELQTFQNVLLPVPLEADRVDVVWENTSTGFMVSADEPDKFEIAGDPIFSAYVAFGVSKERPELRDTLQATLQHLMDEGVYEAIFTEWDQADLMMDYISVNSDNRDL